jgi:hypothetical protein
MDDVTYLDHEFRLHAARRFVLAAATAAAARAHDGVDLVEEDG